MTIQQQVVTRIGIVILSFILIAGCQITSKSDDNYQQANNNLYLDEQFPSFKKVAIESEQEIFALNDNMRAMVHEQLINEHDERKRAIKLLQHIFDQDNVALAYKSGANITAIQAYNSQSANCLSLTIMAYALAAEAGFQVRFQEVDIPEYWVRNGQFNMLTGHVNLNIIKRKNPNQMIVYGTDVLTIDFDPFVVKKHFPKKTIDKQRVLAMFYNNKGAQALVDDDYDKAYAYFRAATQMSPDFSSSWGNIGILYRITNHDDFALQSYRYALEIDKNNFNVLTNLSLLLDTQGNIEEVNEIQRILHKKRVTNPYYHALLGDEAYYDGEFQQALKHYRKAIKLDKKIHEFHFGLAKVYYALDDNDNAQKSMKKAIAYSQAVNIDHSYIAKLNFLKDLGVSH